VIVVALAACTSGDTDPDDGHTPGTDTTDTPTDTDTPSDTDDTPSDTDDPGTGDRVLTVVGGYGGGPAVPGQIRHVWADLDPQAAIVTSWVDTSGLLDSPLEWNTFLVMPDHDVTVEAVIEAVPITYQERTVLVAAGNRDILVVEPTSSVGLVLFFHGAAYAIDQLRTNAGASIAMRLVRAGFTVVAVQSEAEAAAGIGGWSSSLTNNADLQNVESLKAVLLADGTVDVGQPVYAWGKSSGGVFTHTVGAAGLVDAVVSYCAAGTDDAMDVTTAPTAWYLAAEDQTFPTAIADATADQATLQGRGLATDLYVHPPTPLYDQRFERVTGVDATTSAALANQIRAAHDVDQDDLWLVAGTAVDVNFPPGFTPAQETAVEAEVEMMAADHELFDDSGARMVEFLTTLP
jgi:hypothetical protein